MLNALVTSLGLAVSLSVQEPAQKPATLASELHQAVTGGRWWLRLRPRVEFVDQDGFDHDAWASTLRTVLGYETARWHGASVLLEFEDVSAIGNERPQTTTPTTSPPTRPRPGCGPPTRRERREPAPSPRRIERHTRARIRAMSVEDPVFPPRLVREDEPEFADDGVDLTLIRWMLSLTPAERLRTLEEQQAFYESVPGCTTARS